MTQKQDNENTAEATSLDAMEVVKQELDGNFTESVKAHTAYLLATYPNAGAMIDYACRTANDVRELVAPETLEDSKQGMQMLAKNVAGFVLSIGNLHELATKRTPAKVTDLKKQINAMREALLASGKTIAEVDALCAIMPRD